MKYLVINIIFTFLLLFGFINTSAQPKIIKVKESKVDSLETILKSTQSDSIKILLWCAIAEAQSVTSLDLAIESAEKALRNAKRIDNIELIGQTKLTLGKLYFGFGKFAGFLNSTLEGAINATEKTHSKIKKTKALTFGVTLEGKKFGSSSFLIGS